MMTVKRTILFLAVLLLAACGKEPQPVELTNGFVKEFRIDGRTVKPGGSLMNVAMNDIVIDVVFSSEIDKQKADLSRFSITKMSEVFEFADNADPKTLSLRLKAELPVFETYIFTVMEGEMCNLDLIDSYRFTFTTEMDDSDKFERISTDSLLTLVQQRTFSYFWDYAHPVSGLSRERFNSENTVTSGGSGFGVMTIPVGIERGFITRDEGALRVQTIVTFLEEKAERFHGAFPHWMNGETGKALPFSDFDNGADLVETALLMQGLLAARQYFNLENDVESDIRQRITSLWEAVEWDWFLNGTDALYWHWSPDHAWEMGMQVNGWNEALILYVLAASSPTHPIDKDVYDKGWARNGDMINGRKFHDITLPLGPDYGGPLFFTHYSFLGLDPRGLKDAYAGYWEHNTAHVRINHAYCKANPKGFYGYSEKCWGLTASDYHGGYAASSPTNDKGTIAPTAALSSMPYTPEESIMALEYFYYTLGDRLFGKYGFRDAFTLGRKWFADSYIAIDQGPIVIMIENHRTGLLWNAFMQDEQIQAGLTKLGFTYGNE